MRHTVEITRFDNSYEIKVDDVEEVAVDNYTPNMRLTMRLSRDKAHALRDELVAMCGPPQGYVHEEHFHD